ncbi:MAG TPA: endonuclease/exonuclease/phosphatase family protein [Gemmatimonadaceae bacterium]|nr:endonuclease/exonuclease/phosphatase family protein [Gemmatimonadaceae bacterium]
MTELRRVRRFPIPDFRFPIALLLLGSACVRPAPAPDPDASIDVLVFNIRAGTDVRGVHNLERVAEVVRETGAEIVLLQEVDRLTTRSGGEDQIARLSAFTGMHGAFGKTLDYQGGQYGIAMLSRLPIARDTLHPLPIDPPQARAGGSYEPRGAQYAAIPVGADTLHVFNTHLDASRDDANRRQEARALLAIAAPLLERGARVMIGGDLNSLPESAVLALLTAGPMRDAWPLCGAGQGFTFPDSLPVRRIDYLLLGPGLDCSAARVLGGGPSDHRGVLFRLRAPN